MQGFNRLFQPRSPKDLHWMSSGSSRRALDRNERELLPGRVQVELRRRMAEASEAEMPAFKRRFVADTISSITEVQAVRTHDRLVGIESGPFLDPAIF
jgi:dGTP triphosphohydrolase